MKFSERVELVKKIEEWANENNVEANAMGAVAYLSSRGLLISPTDTTLTDKEVTVVKRLINKNIPRLELNEVQSVTKMLFDIYRRLDSAEIDNSPILLEAREVPEYILGNDATVIFGTEMTPLKPVLYSDNEPHMQICSDSVFMGIKADQQALKIHMTKEQAKAIIKSLKMQMKRLGR